MILNLFRKNPANDAVHAVYRSIVAQSRQPVFYAEWSVPDSVTGRFDMITLHMGLFFRRLRRSGQEAGDFSQALFDLFFKDMDRSLREMGVSDLGVPKKIQNMGNMFYGLLGKVNEAMDAGDEKALQDVLARNLFAGAGSQGGDRDAAPAQDVARLAAYLTAQSHHLATQDIKSLLAGSISWESGL